MAVGLVLVSILAGLWSGQSFIVIYNLLIPIIFPTDHRHRVDQGISCGTALEYITGA